MTIAAITESHPDQDLAALFPGAEIKRMASIPARAQPDIAAYVDLDFIADRDRIEKLGRLLPALVFVNAVTPTLREIGRPFVRINAWPGFARLQLHELVIPGITPEAAADSTPGPTATTATGTTLGNPARTTADTTPGNPASTRTDTTPVSATNAAHEAAHYATSERVRELYRQLDCRYLVAPDVPGMISARVVAGIINEAWYTWEEKVSSKEEIDTAMRLGTNYPLGPFEWGERIGLGEIAGLLLALSQSDERYTPANSLLKAAGKAHEAASKAAGGGVNQAGTTD
jgi:hypothetical protein